MIGLDQLLSHRLHAHGLVDGVADPVQATLRAGFLYGATPTCHRGLGARIEGYHHDDLARCLEVDRTLVRVSGMRGAVFLVPPELVGAALSLNSSHGAAWLLKAAGLDGAAYVELADAMLGAMGSDVSGTRG